MQQLSLDCTVDEAVRNQLWFTKVVPRNPATKLGRFRANMMGKRSERGFMVTVGDDGSLFLVGYPSARLHCRDVSGVLHPMLPAETFDRCKNLYVQEVNGGFLYEGRRPRFSFQVNLESNRIQLQILRYVRRLGLNLVMHFFQLPRNRYVLEFFPSAYALSATLWESPVDELFVGRKQFYATKRLPSGSESLPSAEDGRARRRPL